MKRDHVVGVLVTKKRSFVRDAASVVASRGLSRIAQFLIGVLIARAIGPAGRGLVASLSVPVAMAVSLSEMGVRQATAYQIGRGHRTVEEILPTLVGMAISSSLIGLAATLIYYQVAGVAEHNWSLRCLAAVAIPVSIMTSYASGILLGRQRIAAFSSASWAPTFLNLLIIVGLGWVVTLNVYGVVAANLIATAVGAAYALYLVSKEAPIRIGFDRKVASALARQGLAYALALFVLTLNYKVGILLLQKLRSLGEVGIYAQGAAIAEMIWEVPTVLNALVFSRSANAQDSQEFSRKVLVLARLSFLLATCGAIVLAIAAPVAFPLVYGHGFRGSADVFVVLLPGVVAFTVFKILNMDLAGRGKPWISMVIVLPAALLNGGLGYFLILKYGAIGGAISASVAYIVATIVMVPLYARIVGLSYRDVILFHRSDFNQLLSRLPVKWRR